MADRTGSAALASEAVSPQPKPQYPAPGSPGRSANMRAIRRANTKPEIALRSALHRQGYRFRKDYRLDLDSGARVRPDIAFTARRVAVFVDGCFWHACPQHGRNPTVNEWYWGPKLHRTVERDRVADAALLAAGWQVVRIWEHVPLADALAAVAAALEAGAGARGKGTGPASPPADNGFRTRPSPNPCADRTLGGGQPSRRHLPGRPI
jgi:DNA mismatch endonuclease (patch repair protein)